jgi:hypothetical protein
MVLEHQTQMHNALTRANYEARMAQHQNQTMNQALGRPADYLSESTQRRIMAAADDVLKYLLFSDEYRLTAPVRGTSGFATHFSRLGPRDGLGRSLRDFDLTDRLFKYPCSYLIYSPSFENLPNPVKDHVYQRLRRILICAENDEAFGHLTRVDREAILDILTDTKPDFAAHGNRR